MAGWGGPAIFPRVYPYHLIGTVPQWDFGWPALWAGNPSVILPLSPQGAAISVFERTDQ